MQSQLHLFAFLLGFVFQDDEQFENFDITSRIVLNYTTKFGSLLKLIKNVK